jgi:error-prone DNA polymerase
MDTEMALIWKETPGQTLILSAPPGTRTPNPLAARFRLPTVATGNVHNHRPGRQRLAQALAAVQARRSLDEMDGWLAAAGTTYLRSGDEMADRFTTHPDAVAQAARLGAELAFDLNLIAPQLPPCEVGEGHTEMSWLRQLTENGARQRYGSREQNPAAYRQLEHELDTIERLGFPGVQFQHRSLPAEDG